MPFILEIPREFTFAPKYLLYLSTSSLISIHSFGRVDKKESRVSSKLKTFEIDLYKLFDFNLNTNNNAIQRINAIHNYKPIISKTKLISPEIPKCININTNEC